jgi:hypothetical protein
MGICVYARKTDENDEYVIYVCGNSPERLDTTFRIDKSVLENGLADSQSRIAVRDIVTILNTDHKGYWIAILGKIFRYYQEYNTFPDKISRES